MYGSPRHVFDNTDTDMVYVKLPDGRSGGFSENALANDPSISNLLIRFYMKAGPFLNITVGPGFLFGEEKYKVEALDQYGNPDEQKFEIEYLAPSVNTGVSFVKRWYPLKVNVGFLLNLFFPITSYSYSDYETDEQETDFDVRLTYGFRTGAEIMAGKHVGFSADFLYQNLQFDTKFNFDESIISSDINMFTQEIILSTIGLGLGVNFYF